MDNQILPTIHNNKICYTQILSIKFAIRFGITISLFILSFCVEAQSLSTIYDRVNKAYGVKYFGEIKSLYVSREQKTTSQEGKYYNFDYIPNTNPGYYKTFIQHKLGSRREFTGNKIESNISVTHRNHGVWSATEVIGIPTNTKSEKIATSKKIIEKIEDDPDYDLQKAPLPDINDLQLLGKREAINENRYFELVDIKTKTEYRIDAKSYLVIGILKHAAYGDFYTSYGDFRRIGNCTYPFRIEYDVRNGIIAKEQKLTLIDQISVNPTIDSTLFIMPTITLTSLNENNLNELVTKRSVQFGIDDRLKEGYKAFFRTLQSELRFFSKFLENLSLEKSDQIVDRFYERNKDKLGSFPQADFGWYNAYAPPKCLSGNCIDGDGVLLSGQKKIICTFKNGIPVGKGFIVFNHPIPYFLEGDFNGFQLKNATLYGKQFYFKINPEDKTYSEVPIVIAGDSVACACTGGSFTKPELKLNACDLRFSQIAIFLYSHKKGYFAFDGECIYPININNAQTNEEIMNAIIRGNFSDTTVTYHFLESLSNEGFTFEAI